MVAVKQQDVFQLRLSSVTVNITILNYKPLIKLHRT